MEFVSKHGKVIHEWNTYLVFDVNEFVCISDLLHISLGNGGIYHSALLAVHELSLVGVKLG